MACGLIIYEAGGVSGSKNGLSSLSSQFTGNENDVCNSHPLPHVRLPTKSGPSLT